MQNKIIKILDTYSRTYFQTHDVPAWTVTCIFRIIACAKKELGDVIKLCLDCSQTYLVACTCKAKNCPSCGFMQTVKWLKKAAEVFPTMPYQHIVFTLPLFVRPFFDTNFKLMVKIQFDSASEALAKFARSKGVESFWLGVFQYCGVLLNQNPHIHIIAPCGGLTLDGSSFKEFCYYHALTLSKFYTAIFLAKLRDAYKSGELYLPSQYVHLDTYDKFNRFIDKNVRRIKKEQRSNKPSIHAHFIADICPDVGDPRYRSWNVYAGAVRKDRAPFGYIVRYLHHPPISQYKIKVIDTRRDRIVIHVKNPITGLKEDFHFTPDQFMERFCAQFPPKGFHAVRRGGLMAPRKKALFQKLCDLVKDLYPNMISAKDDILAQMYKYKVKDTGIRVCKCGGELVTVKRLKRNHWIYDLYSRDKLKELSYAELKLILLDDTS